MQKENTKPTQEEKEQYFAAHWSVPCINNDQWIWRNNDKFKDINYGLSIEGCYAELTPVTDITNEDAIGVSEIVVEKFTGEMDARVENIKQWSSMYVRSSSQIGDFLRSKGYALPWRGYTVEQLISFGWLKLKQKGGEQDARH